MTDAAQSPEHLTATEREELLRRSWMATDGLWYYQTATQRGIDGANEANIQVVREFGRQEMVRLMRSLGVEKVETVEQYRRLFQTAVELYLGSLFAARESYADGVQHLEVSTCFAYKGVKRAGIEKVYHCGPGERLTGWLQAMDLPAEIDPGVGLCQLAHTGACNYRLTVALPHGS
ncbi:hypothetical protein H8N01_23190 [Streptomyces sp. AC536]|uniref:DUF6125 family protein n=1 Tax=Streptomyces buecherae TaxID=2763006 RepID=UPI00164DDAFC|nr:DUF6125 family protein [Streptomyces buecherae]MBC3985403.1 hypothetical protein [Streptomyces buecherae]QNJ43757.1 hypothetical protein H7H31_31870 [Streptomyces buecherae]